MKRPSRTVICGIDTPDIRTWPEALWAYFTPASLAERLGSAYHRVLFAPSFHPECCVTVLDNGGTADVSLLTYRTNLWYWECYQRQQANGGWWPADPPPPAPQRWEEAAAADHRLVRQFREDLPSAVPLLPEQMNCGGCDGMLVYCRFRSQGGEPQESNSWQDSEPGTHQLVVAVHRLASAVLHEAESRRVLEAVKNYWR